MHDYAKEGETEAALFVGSLHHDPSRAQIIAKR